MRKILITGAHFTPAQAVIESLLNQQESGNIRIIYVGRKTTMEGDNTPSAESKILPRMGITYRTITTGRLRRYISWATFYSLLKIPIGFIQALTILLQEKPDVTLSFGGYVAVPLVFWSWVLKIPVVVHEQTLVSGLANTISSYFASRIALTFDPRLQDPKSGYSLSDKMVITGNPIRSSILAADKQSLQKLDHLPLKSHPLIVVTGGNQGSHIINQTLEEILEKIVDRYTLIHQTGDSKFNDYERLLEKRKSLANKERYIVSKFINSRDWGAILHRADLVITRAGANTLLELAFIGVPSIMIPLPNIHKDEQVVNAAYFEKIGLGVTLAQSHLSAESLMMVIDKVYDRYQEYKSNAKKAGLSIPTDAAEKIARIVLSL